MEVNAFVVAYILGTWFISMALWCMCVSMFYFVRDAIRA